MTRFLAALLLAGVAPFGATADPLAIVERNGALISVEPYGPRIVRVTIATDRGQVEGAPGYGITAKSHAAGWNHQADAAGDHFAAASLALAVVAQPWPRRRARCNAILRRRCLPSRSISPCRTAARSPA